MIRGGEGVQQNETEMRKGESEHRAWHYEVFFQQKKNCSKSSLSQSNASSYYHHCGAIEQALNPHLNCSETSRLDCF